MTVNIGTCLLLGTARWRYDVDQYRLRALGPLCYTASIDVPWGWSLQPHVFGAYRWIGPRFPAFRPKPAFQGACDREDFLKCCSFALLKPILRVYYSVNRCTNFWVTWSVAMTTIKIRNVGNSLGVVLPKEMIARLRVTKGDSLFVQETVDGIRLTPYDPEFQQQMEIAKMVMREDRDALRALSK